MIICICNRISDRQISEAIEKGAQCWTDVHAHHGHVPNCGSCECDIQSQIACSRPARILEPAE